VHAGGDVAAAREVVQRLLPQYASQLELRVIAGQSGPERARIASEDGRIAITGTTSSALLFGVNWYLKYVARLQVSPNGDQLGSVRQLPLPKEVLEVETRYPYRYALNENVDGYTSPYWDWERWQREIDVLALSGVNALLIERGTDMVLYRTFRDFGYSDEEIDATAADPRTSEMLNVPRRDPLLRIRQVIYSTKGKPVIYVLGIYRSDRHNFVIRRFR